MSEVEVMIDNDPKRVFAIKAEPADLFCVLKGILSLGKSPKIRHYDQDANGFTCWQPIPQIRLMAQL